MALGFEGCHGVTAQAAILDSDFVGQPLVVDARQAISEERVHLRRGEGVLQARPGDWVVTAPDGGQWVVEQDIFAQTYALLDQADG